MKIIVCFIIALKIIFSPQIALGQEAMPYDTIIAKGNIAIGERQYKSAISYFEKALEVKQSDPYALYQLHFAEGLFRQDSLEVAERERKTEAQLKEERRKRIFNLAMTAYSNYENAAQYADYESQLLFLKEFLNLVPDTSELYEYQAGHTNKIDFAKKKIITIRSYLSRLKGPLYQTEAVPYTDEELKRKFPGINFSKPPIGQMLEPVDSSSLKEIFEESKIVLAKKPELNISDSVANIKVTCQNISFKDNNVYFKFCIRNYNTIDFITGPMHLNTIKKDKKQSIIPPVYVSNYPIVTADKEFFITYVTKPIKVENKEQLNFEIKDLYQNKILKIDIPRSVLEKK